MLFGPVFNAELITTARRPRYYVIRFLYGLIVLFQIYLSYQANAWQLRDIRAEITIREMADFGEKMFNMFAILQGVTVVLLTPALVGGTIADERQRKTLHYLLTSQLSSAEIVLGKLAARLIHVGVLVALGLPVVSLIGLFGGVDFPLLLLCYAGTLTTLYFLSAMSILVSVESRRPREAISLLYLLEFVWLIVPMLLMSLMPTWVEPWPGIYEWVEPILRYAATTSPLFLLSSRGFGVAGGPAATALLGMGLQLAFGTAFVAIAAIRLRPSYRNEGGGRGWSGRFAAITRRKRWMARPECGDDPMLWKERYVSRTGGLTKVAIALLGLLMGGTALAYTYDFLSSAATEMWNDGYYVVGGARRDFNAFLRGVGTGIYVLWFLGIASSAASGLTGEREEDTWLSLTATPLSGDEILRAKMIAPIWALRPLAFLLFLLWGLGLAVGSIHPLGLIACLIEFAVFTWFLTALGTYFSLRSRNSTRSLASTIALLIFLNGGYLFCCIPFQPDTAAILAGSTPVVFAMSLVSLSDIGNLSGRNEGEMFVACLLCVFFYGAAAAGLTTVLFQTFDSAVNRPDRSRQGRTTFQQAEMLKGMGKEVAFLDELP